MKASVIVFPASNCDRDVAVALERFTGRAPEMVWHGQGDLPPSDLIVLPGGFSYGDYLRPGAIAVHSPIMREIVAAAGRGVPVIGICNGFQVLTEAGLLPGALIRNAGLAFVCRVAELEVAGPDSPFTRKYEGGQKVRIPIAHNEGNYVADEDTLDRLEAEGLVAFRYSGGNPNGAARGIAGIMNERRTILGLMPHPERAIDDIHPSRDGLPFFEGLVEALS
ncbi:MAG: phosphoribosylformylglycinamidine synthase subunit PurQ [Alphaproteobacteria bacterium]